MKLLFSLLFSLIALTPAWADAPDGAERPPLLLVLGEQRVLKIPGLERYSLGGDAVRAVVPPGGAASHDQILLKGTKPGIADLWVWKEDAASEHRTIRVSPLEKDSLKPGLLAALSRLDETEVVFSGTGVILRGEIRGMKELTQIQALVRGYPQDVIDETETAEDLLESARTALESWLRKSPYSDRLEVQIVDRNLILRLIQGSIAGPAEKARIEKRARGIFPGVIVDVDSLPDTSPTVHFKVLLLELHRTRFRSLGITWPAQQEGAFRVTSSGVQSALQLDLTLQALENEGSAKVLSSPELVVRAPGEAELFSGGELPIQSQSAYYSNITWKTFGLTLKLKVDKSAGDRVRLDIQTEVSHLDATLKTDKIPGLQSNRMKTQVDARFGKPLFLSGLLQQGTRKEARGLPFLRDIPILGLLFGSEDYLNEKSELVAILVPSREAPEAPMPRFDRAFPKGPVPASRQTPRPTIERAQRRSPEFPWNVL